MKRFFLVGCPRSGTTLLQSLLACTPGMATFTESHLFARCIALRYGIAVPYRSPRKEAERFLRENGIEPDKVLQRLGTRRMLTTAGTVRTLLAVLDAAAEARGATAFLEKTPRHLHYISMIERSGGDLEDSHFVHVIRDGIAVAASLTAAAEHWPRHNPNALVALARWQSDISIAAGFRDKPRHHFVDYDYLVADPENVVLMLARRLGLSLTSNHLARREKVVGKIVRFDEHWKHDTIAQRIEVRNRSVDHVGQQTLDLLAERIDRTEYDRLRERAVRAA